MADNRITAPGTLPEAPSQTRREALGAIGFTGLAGIAVAAFVRPETLRAESPTPSADAELIALCDKMDDLERRFILVSETEPANEKEQCDAIAAEQRPIIKQIAATRAMTVEGVRAKAASLHLWAADVLEEPNDADPVELLTASILRDLLGGTVS